MIVPSSSPGATDPFPIVAIIAAYNEEDVIGQVVGNLVEQGILVYLMDHHSTDGTVTAIQPYLGRGLIGIEQFPGVDRPNEGDPTRFTLAAIMRRKEQLAGELQAEWFINHDADEFRESPWAHLDLKSAIQAVDRAGYNAIDFEVLNFWPTHDHFRPGDDVRDAFRFYERGQRWDKLQIRCWKRTRERVDLASTGGHEAIFADRQVFPVRFILRHYPIRGQAHGERKVFRERRPRFDEEERRWRWHLHYDAIREGQSFLHAPESLTRYDPETVRLDLVMRHRGVEEQVEAAMESRRSLDRALARLAALETQLAERDGEITRVSHHLDALDQAVGRQRGEIEGQAQEIRRQEKLLAEQNDQIGLLRAHAEGQAQEIRRQEKLLAEQNDELARLQDRAATGAHANQQLAATIAQLYASRSWRFTAPLRAVSRLLRGTD